MLKRTDDALQENQESQVSLSCPRPLSFFRFVHTCH